MDSTRPYRSATVIRKAANNNRMPKSLVFRKVFLLSGIIAGVLIVGFLLLR